MITLTRETRQSLQIGDTKVIFTDLKDGKARLAIEAPPEVSIRLPDKPDQDIRDTARAMAVAEASVAA